MTRRKWTPEDKAVAFVNKEIRRIVKPAEGDRWGIIVMAEILREINTTEIDRERDSAVYSGFENIGRDCQYWAPEIYTYRFFSAMQACLQPYEWPDRVWSIFCNTAEETHFKIEESDGEYRVAIKQ